MDGNKVKFHAQLQLHYSCSLGGCSSSHLCWVQAMRPGEPPWLCEATVLLQLQRAVWQGRHTWPIVRSRELIPVQIRCWDSRSRLTLLRNRHTAQICLLAGFVLAWWKGWLLSSAELSWFKVVLAFFCVLWGEKCLAAAAYNYFPYVSTFFRWMSPEAVLWETAIMIANSQHPD